jgi:hypothetical protein
MWQIYNAILDVWMYTYMSSHVKQKSREEILACAKEGTLHLGQAYVSDIKKYYDGTERNGAQNTYPSFQEGLGIFNTALQGFITFLKKSNYNEDLDANYNEVLEGLTAVPLFHSMAVHIAHENRLLHPNNDEINVIIRLTDQCRDAYYEDYHRIIGPLLVSLDAAYFLAKYALKTDRCLRCGNYVRI